MPGRPIIIDTDPGQDDAVAILLALASDEVEVLGITTVAGNGEVGFSGDGVRPGPWLVPLVVGFLFIAGMGAMVGGYPLRRDLSGEANPLHSYVVRGARGVLAMFGFWRTVLLLHYRVQS